MAFLGRRGRAREPEPPRPISATDEDLRRAPGLFRDFERSVGNDPALRESILAIAMAGGAPSAEQAITAAARNADLGIDRPWRWLVAVAREARHRQDRDLLAHLAVFVGMWTSSYEPIFLVGDRMEVRLDKAPAALLGEIYSIVLPELQQLDPGQVMVDHHTGRMTVADVVLMSAVITNGLPALVVEPPALELARRAIG